MCLCVCGAGYMLLNVASCGLALLVNTVCLLQVVVALAAAYLSTHLPCEGLGRCRLWAALGVSAAKRAERKVMVRTLKGGWESALGKRSGGPLAGPRHVTGYLARKIA